MAECLCGLLISQESARGGAAIGGSWRTRTHVQYHSRRGRVRVRGLSHPRLRKSMMLIGLSTRAPRNCMMGWSVKVWLGPRRLGYVLPVNMLPCLTVEYGKKRHRPGARRLCAEADIGGNGLSRSQRASRARERRAEARAGASSGPNCPLCLEPVSAPSRRMRCCGVYPRVSICMRSCGLPGFGYETQLQPLRSLQSVSRMHLSA